MLESAETVLLRNASAMAPSYDDFDLVAWVRTATPLAREVNTRLLGMRNDVDSMVQYLILAHLQAWMDTQK